MSGHFDIGLGQQICDIFSAELGFVCNLMGENGRIVASGERAWIGSIHPIAAQIMRGEMDEYSVTLEEAAKSDTMCEGSNTAIDFDGVRIANFSIAGPLEIVRPLAQVVRFCVKFILRNRQEAVVPDPQFDEGSPSTVDVTNLMEMLKQAEVQLEARDRTWHEFAELSSDWFWAQDAKFRFIGFSGTAPERLRRKQSDYFGKRRWELPIFGVSTEELAEHQAICERHEPFHNFEYQIPSSEGVPQYYCTSGIPVFNPQGEFVGYRGIGTNVTELRLAELAIKESEQKLSQIVEGSPIPAFVIDVEHRVTHWNHACEELTGLPKAKVIGRIDTYRAFYLEPRHLLADLVVSESKEYVITAHYENFGPSPLVVGAVEAEAFLPHMGEDGRWLFFTAAPLRDSAGKLTGAIETLQDVTKSKATDSQRKRLAAELAHTQKMESLGGLASGVAHDMNNLLGAILLLASLHEDQAADGSPLKKSMATITLACHRGGNLVKGLLGFARRDLAEEKVLDLNQLAQEQVALLERSTFQKIRIEADLANDLMPIKGDQGALSHALLNLCVNALDAMEAGGTLTFISHNGDDGMVFLEVVDTGVGMSKEVLDKAMDPFFTTKPQGKGIGLGLSIVYNTVKAHRGKVVIQSQPGTGTRVTLCFPSCEPNVQPGEPAAVFRPPVIRRSLHILLVDDDELIRIAIPELIGYLGHRTTTATNGEGALVQIKEGLRPDVVILDLNMPGLGGARTLPLLRALLPKVPVIIATGRADQDAIDLMEAHEYVTLCAKPFDTKELQQKLGSLDGLF